MTLIITTFSTMTFGITPFSITTFSIMTFSITTFSIMTFSTNVTGLIYTSDFRVRFCLKLVRLGV